MKAVLISIQPKWCELIANGKKTVEVRKNRPTIRPPFKCYIYCTKKGRPLVYGSPVPSYVEENLVQTYGYSRERADKIFGIWNGKVIGEFVCDEIMGATPFDFVVKEDADEVLSGTYLTRKELYNYLGWNKEPDRFKQKSFYLWHISELKIYDEPKELSDFHAPCDSNCIGLCGKSMDYCCRFVTRPPQSWCYVQEFAPCKDEN